MNEILLIKGYALGWFWLNKVPLEDWTWLIEIQEPSIHTSPG